MGPLKTRLLTHSSESRCKVMSGKGLQMAGNYGENTLASMQRLSRYVDEVVPAVASNNSRSALNFLTALLSE